MLASFGLPALDSAQLHMSPQHGVQEISSHSTLPFTSAGLADGTSDNLAEDYDSCAGVPHARSTDSAPTSRESSPNKQNASEPAKGKQRAYTMQLTSMASSQLVDTVHGAASAPPSQATESQRLASHGGAEQTPSPLTVAYILVSQNATVPLSLLGAASGTPIVHCAWGGSVMAWKRQLPTPSSSASSDVGSLSQALSTTSSQHTHAFSSHA